LSADKNANDRVAGERGKYITEEAVKELEKCYEKLRREILAHAYLIANKEDSLEITRSHVIKAYKRVSGLARLEETKIKWFISITLAILLSFAIAQILQVINRFILPTLVIIWIAIFCYIFKDFL
jgi:histone H3/H4